MKNLILIIVFYFFGLASVLCCNCEYSLKEDIKDSKYILIVEISKSFDTATWTEKQFLAKDKIDSSLYLSGYHVEARILKFYKGLLKNDTLIIEGDRNFSCAQEFFIGKKYLVFLSEGDKKTSFSTSVCNHNIELLDENEILATPEEYFNKKD